GPLDRRRPGVGPVLRPGRPLRSRRLGLHPRRRPAGERRDDHRHPDPEPPDRERRRVVVTQRPTASTFSPDSKITVAFFLSSERSVTTPSPKAGCFISSFLAVSSFAE